jgi:4-hydroxy-3-methylbut-2-en-1-yl diphosphate synthase IspG/GcpE
MGCVVNGPARPRRPTSASASGNGKGQIFVAAR